MQITQKPIDFSDHCPRLFRRGRPAGAPFRAGSVPEAMRSISSRKARQTADNSCLARVINATCQVGIGESSANSAIDEGLRLSKNNREGIKVM